MTEMYSPGSAPWAATSPMRRCRPRSRPHCGGRVTAGHSPRKTLPTRKCRGYGTRRVPTASTSISQLSPISGLIWRWPSAGLIVRNADQAYIDEMNQWLRDPDVHAASDGIPLDAIPHVSADHPRHTDVPVRDFEAGVSGRQLIERDIDERPLIGVVFTDSDMPIDQLRSGGGMMRLMIEAQLLGLTSCPLSQAVDLIAFRGRLQGFMGWTDYPQMMLRIGHPAETAQTTPRTPRRATSDVLQVLTNK